MKNPVVAVAGATGAVGKEMLLVLEQRGFPAAQVKALASARSVGKRVPYNGAGALQQGAGSNATSAAHPAQSNAQGNPQGNPQSTPQSTGYLEVEELTAEAFEGVDIALFSAGASVSQQYRAAVTSAGAVMIDNSSAFRMEAGVPLVVPEVNPHDAHKHQGVIANPNCSTIQLAVVLNQLAQLAPLKRVVCSTYQAASGAGAAAMDELYEQTRQFLAGEELTIERFAHQLAFNCIPQIDVFLDDGSTKEEWKMVVETRKILHEPELALAMTCVRVPVLRCHAESVNVEFAAPVNLEQARAALNNANGITVEDNPATKAYPLPGLLAGTDDVYIGRLRSDPSVASGLAFWCVADQLRKGAALNAVQIAELLLES